MGLLLWDYLKRTKIYLGFCLIFFTSQLGTMREGSSLGIDCYLLVGSIALGVGGLLVYDLMKGTFQIERTLPLGKNQFSTLFWVKGVLFPSLLVSLIAIICWKLKLSGFSNGLSLIPWCFVFSGTFFFLSSLFPLEIQSGNWNPRRIAFTLVPFVFAICGSYFLPKWLSGKGGNWDIEVITLFSAMLILTVYSWFRADFLVEGGILKPQKPSIKRKHQEISFPYKKEGILVLYYRNFFIGLALFVLCGGVFLVTRFFFTPPAAPQTTENNFGVMSMMWIVLCVIMGTTIFIMQTNHLKPLRILPISPIKLCGYLFFSPFLWSIFSSSLYLLIRLNSGSSFSFILFLPIYIFATGSLFLASALVLRWGINALYPIIIVYAFGLVIGQLIVVIGPIMYGITLPPLEYFALGSGLCMGVGGFLLGMYFMKNSSKIYKERVIPLGMGKRWN